MGIYTEGGNFTPLQEFKILGGLLCVSDRQCLFHFVYF